MDFEENFTLDAYFEILTHTVAHIHSTKAYKKLLEQTPSNLGYLPLLIALKARKKHIKVLCDNNVLKEEANGIYRLVGTPFFYIYLLLITEMNLAKQMLQSVELCDDIALCESLAEQLKNPDIWDTKVLAKNPQLKKCLNKLLDKFGELVLLLNLNMDYVIRVWRYTSRERRKISKDILDSMLILFLKEVKHMSISQILSKKEKKELIEAMGIKDAIEAVGVEKVIEVVSIDKVLDMVGVEKVIDTISKKLNLNEEDKRLLKSLLMKSKK